MPHEYSPFAKKFQVKWIKKDFNLTNIKHRPRSMSLCIENFILKRQNKLNKFGKGMFERSDWDKDSCWKGPINIIGL